MKWIIIIVICMILLIGCYATPEKCAEYCCDNTTGITSSVATYIEDYNKEKCDSYRCEYAKRTGLPCNLD